MGKAEGDLVLEICILDFETEGLDEREESILECYVMHVDNETLEIKQEEGWVLTERFKSVLHPAAQSMHEVSGLFDAIAYKRAHSPMFTVGDLDVALLRFFQSVNPEPGKIMLAGNSIGQFDVRFMRRYTPKALRHLHYRVIDLSGYLELHKLFCNPLPKPEEAHRARADCLKSLRAMRMAKHTLNLAYANCGKDIVPESAC